MPKPNDSTVAPEDCIRAIPTEYKGVQLKSRMEAQLACFFDRIGWKWEYEPRSIMLKTGISYTPDFSIHSGDLIVECRGYRSSKGDRQIADFAAEFRDHGGCDYAVLGPEECLLYTSFDASPIEVRLTYCPRCEEWGFESVQRGRWSFCPNCVQITFASYRMSVSDGKFYLGTTPLEDCVFDKDAEKSAWTDDFLLHVIDSLNRHELFSEEALEKDKAAVKALHGLTLMFRSGAMEGA